MKRINLAVACLWISLLAPAHLVAQHRKTLDSLWEKTLVYFPGIHAKQASIDIASIQQRTIKSRALPQARVQTQNSYGTYAGSYGAFFPQPGFFNVTGNASTTDGSSFSANSFGSATLEWELFAFGKQRKENEAASYNHRKTVAEKEHFLLELKKELSLRYIHLLYHAARQEWSKNNSNRLKEISRIAAAFTVSGLKPAADSLLAHAAWLKAKAAESHATGNKEAAYWLLTELYGEVSSDRNFISTQFLRPASGATDNPVTPEFPYHPSLVSMTEERKYYEADAAANHSASLPSLKLLAGYAFRGTGINNDGYVSGKWRNGFSNTTSNVLAGIGITWNITNLHSGKLKKQQSNKKAEQIQSLIEATNGKFRASLMATKSRIDEQHIQLQHANTAITESLSAYNMYLARFKSGLLSLTELLQIRHLLEEAEKELIEAALKYWTERVNESFLTTDFRYLFNNL